MKDPVLETLFLPFSAGDLDWPEGEKVLFLRARMSDALKDATAGTVDIVQSFAPHAVSLEKAGFEVKRQLQDENARYPLVLVLPPRQREEARTLLATAFAHAAPGGMVVACQSNTEGARTLEHDIERLAGAAASRSKHKARAVWATADRARLDFELIAEWRLLDAPRPIGDGRFVSRPGLFAWDRLDAGTATLAANLPASLKGRAADLGAGYGALADALLARAPKITALDLYEAEDRALELCRQNLAPYLLPTDGSARDLQFYWRDVTTGLVRRDYDVIVSNPPFHEGRADRADIGQAFIRAAAFGLKPGGEFWLVANRHLPYEATLGEHFASVTTVAESEGYKVIRAARPKARR
ncbi:class I SAM-dependent methyltransferase [Stappia sp. F7233]|uniref:Class I SAM-dependent methyltransferase n=1 Tax=Stappia albiluteola TaxID=2758565 RepID=A0A839AF84_9HYPH|nr:methyltransferase [Stappia albiluteola]MBA5777604.1 class I SAM-dependent methyltransferase [Stappia albiluteola]